jgi:hypothetical protein
MCCQHRCHCNCSCHRYYCQPRQVIIQPYWCVIPPTTTTMTITRPANIFDQMGMTQTTRGY